MPKTTLLVAALIVSCSGLRLSVFKKESKSSPPATTIPFGVQHHTFSLKLGAPVDLARVPGEGSAKKDYGGAAPQVLFTHLLKAGGSRVEAIMQGLMFDNGQYSKQSYKSTLEEDKDDKNPLKDVAEFVPTGHLSTTHSKYFRLGLIRNPCDYLVSMWSFQSQKYDPNDAGQGHGTWPRKCLQQSYAGDANELFGTSPGVNTADDVAKFRKWVRAAGGTRLHYLTYRSYVALHNDTHLLQQSWDDGQLTSCIGDQSDEQQKAIAEKLMAADLSRRYDCLIHTETLEADTKTCMVKFAETIPNQETRNEFLQKVHAYNFEKVVANPSTHAKCSEYYDDATEAWVWEREGPFARKMGYNTCCSGA